MSLYYIIALYFGAYLSGSIPFGKLVAQSYNIDIQTRGSGNIGFANVRRIVGWRAGIITLGADITKGFLPVVLALHFFDATTAFFVGIVAILGHVFPIWLRFRGGKGIATGLGVLLALQPFAALIGAAAYVVSCYVTKVSSRSSIIGLSVTALVGVVVAPSTWWYYIVLIIIAIWTLRHNLTGKVPNYDT
ncbi:glycerol-3-phosphate acyltransferase [bacterium]|nr:MAG: glycerol-3-phosphate acyltransferase [bacterium]